MLSNSNTFNILRRLAQQQQRSAECAKAWSAAKWVKLTLFPPLLQIVVVVDDDDDVPLHSVTLLCQLTSAWVTKTWKWLERTEEFSEELKIEINSRVGQKKPRIPGSTPNTNFKHPKIVTHTLSLSHTHYYTPPFSWRFIFNNPCLRSEGNKIK